MFVFKKHISRRTVLKTAGASLALPFLDAMVPAATALAQTAAAPKLRAGFFYLPHGAIMHNTVHGPKMDKWTPSGAGADYKLNVITGPLEPYKKYVTSFANLENAATAGFDVPQVHGVAESLKFRILTPTCKCSTTNLFPRRTQNPAASGSCSTALATASKVTAGCRKPCNCPG